MTVDPAELVRRVSPAVVSIQGRTEAGQVLGSGFILSADGKIATNLHVVKELLSAIVRLPSGESFDHCSVLAADEARDLAIIQISAHALPTLALGSTNTAKIGSRVAVIGNPEGLEGSVTAGILSGIRDYGGRKVLQTDAAVNPGNSGGPLIDAKGRVIGVVSFKLRSAEGLNFAVPIDDVRQLLTKVHDPITLDQLRTSLKETGPSAETDNSPKPSLQETLAWLRAKIPLATVHYRHRLVGGAMTDTVNLQGTIKRFDSCTVTFGYTGTQTTDDHPDWGSSPGSFLYTVPLGILTGWDVVRTENEDGPEWQFVDGERWGYRLMLSTGSNEILRRVSYVSSALVRRTDSVNGLDLTFNDESLARRVASAFRYASSLCHKSEAF